MGHIIENNEIRPIKDNLVAIKEFPKPETKKHIRQFLGKIIFNKEYIPGRAMILEPLHNLLRKNQKFLWTEKCQKSFDKIKDILTSEPVFEIFDKDLPIHIHTDASLLGVGAVLKQVQINGKIKPVAFFLKKLNNAQKKKKAIYLECLAIKEAVRFWQYWLIGKSFLVFTDHKPLEGMNLKSRTDEELGDLTYYLSQYDFQIKYTPGKENVEADCLRRNPVLESVDNKDEILKVVNMIEMKDLVSDQENNEYVRRKSNELIERNGVYFKKTRKKEKIVLSEEFSMKLIKYVHTDWCHIGVKLLQKKISPFYTAKNLTKNIKKICKSCETCIRNKTRSQQKLGLMSQLGPATTPFEITSLDTIGGFGGSRSTKKYLRLLVDHFTR